MVSLQATGAVWFYNENTPQNSVFTHYLQADTATDATGLDRRWEALRFSLYEEAVAEDQLAVFRSDTARPIKQAYHKHRQYFWLAARSVDD